MRVLVMGAPYEVHAYTNRSIADCFEATGFNTGNLLIGNGLVKQLRYDKIATFSPSMSAEYINESFDQIVIPAANFLHPKFDFSPLSSVLEKTNLPVFMVGLGAQLPTVDHEMQHIPDGTWRLVQIAAERSKTVGVRGYFTADVLRKQGIPNVRVTGCPSLYTNLVHYSRIKRVAGSVIDKTVVNGSRNVVDHAADRASAVRVEQQLFRFAYTHRRPFVLQNEQPEIQLSLGDTADAKQSDIITLAKFFSITPDEFTEYFGACGKTFFSVQEWFEWIRGYDFSIGTRFHGNLAALLNGVPAVVLVHDSRTRELCEFAAIPHAFIQDIHELDPQRLYEKANFDLFEERYSQLHRKYVEFLNENKISHKLEASIDLPQRGRISLD